MRKVNAGIPDIIRKIQELKGQSVSVEISRGRKKPETISGFIESIYPSIFTVRSRDQMKDISYSYSYADVLCGDVMLTKLETNLETGEEKL